MVGDVSGDAPASEARVIDLEVRYSHLEDLVEQLSEIVRTQQAQIERLNGAVKQMYGQIEALSAEPTPHERPPHY